MPLTPPEVTIRTRLIQVVTNVSNNRGPGLISYIDVCRLVNLDMDIPADHQRLSQYLDNVSTHDHQAGRPLLSAVVVYSNQGFLTTPGDGFYELAVRLGLHQGRSALADRSE